MVPYRSKDPISKSYRRAQEAERRAEWADECGAHDTAKNARFAAALRRAEAQEHEDEALIPAYAGE